MEPKGGCHGAGLLMPDRPVPFLAGPTAVGKSVVAMELARRTGGEIVSADSRQVYRELTIATAKPGEEDRRRVRHHLVDARSVREPISSGEYARVAEAAIGDILSRGRQPIVVGGSTLHLQAMVFGLADIPPVDPSIRINLQARLVSDGVEALHRRLVEVDPAYAVTLDGSKSQRILRGLEVFEGTGHPLSSYFESGSTPAFEYEVFVLTRDRAELYRRIDERVESMVAGGLIEEARGLAADGFDLEANPVRTIGYHEAAAFLRGEVDLAEMVRRIQVDTRRYAKRQMTWLRRFPSFRWFDLSVMTTEDAVDRILEAPAGPAVG